MVRFVEIDACPGGDACVVVVMDGEDYHLVFEEVRRDLVKKLRSASVAHCPCCGREVVVVE